MKTLVMAFCLVMLLLCTTGQAYVLTIDDIPEGSGLEYYFVQYGIAFCSSFLLTDHSQSTWGPPHSGNLVLTIQGSEHLQWANMIFKRGVTLLCLL